MAATEATAFAVAHSFKIVIYGKNISDDPCRRFAVAKPVATAICRLREQLRRHQLRRAVCRRCAVADGDLRRQKRC